MNPITQFRCDGCNEVFDKGRSDAEAKAELEEDFPGIPLDACLTFCDDCYSILMAIGKPAKIISDVS